MLRSRSNDQKRSLRRARRVEQNGSEHWIKSTRTHYWQVICILIRHLTISNQTDFLHTYSTRRALRDKRFRSLEQDRSRIPSVGTAAPPIWV
ncbi:hypothetical protein RHMOL_Rhmol03G0182200 [Rhododendron molle]|uniref:Uncharacterized protein n=1 Tax=Rhododendron molle TaxID=49168 RepID=A0ACC0PG14_RHOML|nr:hypothetical protein RHMOL_Rhmol03G0182200 [Rhododendron molle]